MSFSSAVIQVIPVVNKNLDAKNNNITANIKAQSLATTITTMLYGNRSRNVLHLIGDPHGIDNRPSVNDNLGYFLDCLGLRPLSDARYSRVRIDTVRLMSATTYDWSGHPGKFLWRNRREGY